MAKLVFGMNQSLDGYVDHMAFAPSPTHFRHFIVEAQGQAGSIYGRQTSSERSTPSQAGRDPYILFRDGTPEMRPRHSLT